MGFEINDIVPCVPCQIAIERNRDNFQIIIKGDNGDVLQDLDSRNLLDGDVLSINGLGFRVAFDGISWTPPKENKPDEIVGPVTQLKRKMDIK